MYQILIVRLESEGFQGETLWGWKKNDFNRQIEIWANPDS
jgi:hypothetical protein